MKWITTLLLALVFAVPVMAAPAVAPGLKISEYPNTPTFTNLDMMILARTNANPRTNLNMKMGDLALQLTNGLSTTGYVNTAVATVFNTLSNYASYTGSNLVVVLPGSNTTVSATSTNGTNFYTVGASAAGATPGVDQAPGTTVIVVDGGSPGIVNRTSVLTSAASVIFSNLTVGLPIKWWGFASNGAWNVGVPQSHDSNTVSRGIEQPFSNTWLMVEATAISSGWTNFDSESQGYTIGPGTNTVFDTNAATRHISVSSASGSTNTLYQTNALNLGSAGTVNFGTGITGSITAGVLTIGNIPLGASFETNQYTTNRSLTPVQGSLYFGDTNGTQLTNGIARVGMEWIPVMRVFRKGELGNQGLGNDTLDVTRVTNYWDAGNSGFGSFVGGSNNMTKGPYSTVVNGMFNIIQATAVASFIGGGSNNVVDTNAVFSFIGGGAINKIRMDSRYCTISGGNDNSLIFCDNATIGGGFGNSMVANCDNGTIAGGSGNTFGGTPSGSATIAGGNLNQINDGSDQSVIAGGTVNFIQTASRFVSIAGGRRHIVSAGADYSSIAGGQSNLITGQTKTFIGGGEANSTGSSADFGSILGGQANNINALDYCSILGGLSNRINGASGAMAIGNFVTNETSSSVEIGQNNNRKARIDVNGLRVHAYSNFTAAVGGTMSVTNTIIASAGAAETNLQFYTIPANVLTNSNDRITFRSSGRFAATSNTKQIKVVFGSETVFDSGAQVANTGAWVVEGEILRTGNTAQSVNATFHGGTNTTFITESSLSIAQTNGIATILKITGTAAGDGDITNRTMVVEWHPAP